MRSVLTPGVRVAALLAALMAACSDTGGSDSGGGGDGRPSIVVTTNILGDVVGEVVGDQVAVEVIMPVGADPHEFAPSAAQAEAMAEADLLIVNGAGFEEGMTDIVEAAEDAGAEVFAFADQVELIEPTGEHGGDEDDGHAGDDGHVDDPHVWTDPTNIAAAVDALAAELAEIEGVDVAAIRSAADRYIEELEQLDQDIEAELADLAPGRRVLVTNHEVFGYFAERYDFKIVGAVIPTLTTQAEPSAADVEELAQEIEEHGAPAVFADSSHSPDLARALAREVGGDIEVVVLFSESLGEPGSGAETYVGMMRTNAERIAEALR